MISIKGRVQVWECIFKDCKALCCTPPLITMGDVRRISKSMGLKPEEFLDIDENEEKGLFRIKGKGSRCMFLQDDYSCKLHGKNSKPVFCQMFPFRFDGITYADEIILKIKPAENCPGYGRGRKIDEKFMLRIEELGSELVREIESYLKEKNKGRKFEEILKS